MIGSPDLLGLAFTGAEGFGAGEEDREAPGPPEELSVPLRPAAHPWSSAARFHRDFILVAEFSEQVGPMPVLTIPDDPKFVGSFDLNHFSVRIMSVDYQASGPGPAPPSSPGPQLNFSEDSKVILGDSAEDAFAYVHHMTLYDLEARGMVRPFCMAYVCSDQAKLMENYWELSSCFSQASDSLKTGNRKVFSLELQKKLQELELTRLTLRPQEADSQRMANGSTEEEQKSDEIEAIERSILSHRDLLRQVTSYPNRKLKQPDFLPYDPADSLTDPAALLPLDPCPLAPASPSASRQSERRLKLLEQLCDEYFLSLMKKQLADAERRLRGDRSVLQTARVTHSLSRRLTLTNFLFELWSPENVEEDEEERDGVEAEPQTSSQKTQGAETLLLESFFSCVEEIPIKLEAEEEESRSPETEAEMTGSVSSGDSIEVLGTEKSYRTQQAAVDLTSEVLQVIDQYSYAKRANSEDSIEVLSTTDSIFPDDLKAITEEEAEHQSLSNGLERGEELQAGCKSDPDEEKSLEDDHLENKDSDDVDDDGTAEEDQDKSLNLRVINVGVTVEEEPDLMKNEVHEDKLPQTVRVVPDLLVSFAPPLPLSEEEQWPPPRPNLRLLSVDEGSDCASFTSVAGSSDSSSLAQHAHASARCSDRNRRRKAGLRALRFIRQNSFSQHAVFCLLSGRPLVVIGGDETSVRRMVDALSLFLPAPGPDGGAVMPCLTTPLQLTDLLTWRLRLHPLSNRYLATLDLDQRTLRGPSYSGSLLGRLADPHSLIGRGVTYLLHVESWLTALANQVLLHTFKPASGGEDGAEEENAPTSCDQRVMHFLSDLVKQRHAGRGPPVLQFSYSPVQLHRNTYVS
uniref:Smith-Magenis syndrome chromosome region, candidate 8b n=1 Tax=Salarias fasciatus TaxID=181472 RepID=A0A672IFK5_SALFA